MYLKLLIGILVVTSAIVQQVLSNPYPNAFNYASETYKNVREDSSEGSKEVFFQENFLLREYFQRVHPNMNHMTTETRNLVNDASLTTTYKSIFPVPTTIPQATKNTLNHWQYLQLHPYADRANNAEINMYTTTFKEIDRKILPQPTQLPRVAKSTNVKLKRNYDKGLLELWDIPADGNDYFLPADYVVYDNVYSEISYNYDYDDAFKDDEFFFKSINFKPGLINDRSQLRRAE
ncbi:hypothetical protein ABEB36_010069 [Hypothenemus hampei]|uniref:Uncharacterized protein n=1 Tax=Hypothenemus hampei TaxID=57062 RepID=A0ABD1EIH6_HYPHA